MDFLPSQTGLLQLLCFPRPCSVFVILILLSFFKIMLQVDQPFTFRNTFQTLQAVTRIKHGHSSVICRNLPTFFDTVYFAYVIAYSKKTTFKFNHNLLLYSLPSSLPRQTNCLDYLNRPLCDQGFLSVM
jgi:hypothetical protein